MWHREADMALFYLASFTEKWVKSTRTQSGFSSSLHMEGRLHLAFPCSSMYYCQLQDPISGFPIPLLHSLYRPERPHWDFISSLTLFLNPLSLIWRRWLCHCRPWAPFRKPNITCERWIWGTTASYSHKGKLTYSFKKAKITMSPGKSRLEHPCMMLRDRIWDISSEQSILKTTSVPSHDRYWTWAHHHNELEHWMMMIDVFH